MGLLEGLIGSFVVIISGGFFFCGFSLSLTGAIWDGERVETLSGGSQSNNKSSSRKTRAARLEKKVRSASCDFEPQLCATQLADP